MAGPQKLTKKQKKAAAFRERKTGNNSKNNNTKNKSTSGLLENDGMEMEDNSIPILEEQDSIDTEINNLEFESVEKKKSGASSGDRKKGKTKGKERAVDGLVEGTVGKSKKRKRESVAVVEDAGTEGESEGPKWKRAKDSVVEGSESIAVDEKVSDSKNQVMRRFILFVGNLKYTTTRENIQAHFAACDPPPTIRLLTPKTSRTGMKTNKSKGCAFLEFTHKNALQQGLKLHQSMLDGRMINVELTAGGGGKSENRIKKVKERNKALFGERKDRLEKADPAGDSTLKVPLKPQRYSSTSGLEQAPSINRTWTVGDIDDGQTHRGGVKHGKSSESKRRPSRNMGTGVNAIPVG